LCPACDGGRLKPEASLFQINGRSVVEFQRMSVAEAAEFFAALHLSAAEEEIADLILRELRNRLRYLLEVGLDYLTLDRQSRTLSGGELARVDLTTAVGSSLVNTLYILDEPSIACTRATASASCASCKSCAPRRTRSWSSSTTRRSFAKPIT